MRLAHLRHDGRVRRREADAHAGHRVGFGERAHVDQPVAQRGVAHQCGQRPVDDAVVDAIGDEEEVVLKRRLLERRQGVFPQHRARRIVGRGEENRARARRDVRGKVLSRDREAVRRRLHRDIHAAAKLDLRLVEPEGRHGHDHLVPGVENRHQRAGERLRRADGHKRLLRRVTGVKAAVEVRGGLRKQLRIAGVRRIMRLPAEDRLRDARAHGQRRVEVRLADRQREATGNGLRRLADAPDAAGRIRAQAAVQKLLHHGRLPPRFSVFLPRPGRGPSPSVFAWGLPSRRRRTSSRATE